VFTLCTRIHLHAYICIMNKLGNWFIARGVKPQCHSTLQLAVQHILFSDLFIGLQYISACKLQSKFVNLAASSILAMCGIVKR